MTAINMAFILYFSACVLFLAGEIFKRAILGRIASSALAMGIIANMTAVILRWRDAGHPPFSNMHESLVFIALSIGIISLFVEIRYNAKLVGAFSTFLAVLALGYASVIDTTIHPLLPALKSNWLIIHVTSYFIGYGALTVATIAACGYLLNIGNTNKLDVLSFRLILFAFPFLTIGLTTGAVWANVAWGRYWGWDPKETWSLITWLVYALYLHVRTMRGWRGKRAVVVSVLGFVFVVFTFLGVNFLIGGLHSYR